MSGYILVESASLNIFAFALIIMIRTIIDKVLVLGSRSSLALLPTALLVHLIKLLLKLSSESVDDLLGVLAGLLGVLLFLLPPTSLLFQFLSVFLVDRLLEHFNLGQLLILGYFELLFTLIIEVKVVLRFF